MTVRRQDRHTRDWLFLLAYLSCVFFFLPFSEYFTRVLLNRWPEFSYAVMISTCLYICFVGFMAASITVAGNKPLKLYRLLALAVILSIAFYGLAKIGNPRDKLHIIEYSLLAFLLFRVLRFYNFTFALYLWCAVFIGIAGLSDELVQIFIPGRHCDIKDWMTDMTTCALSMMIIAFVLCPKLEKWRLRLESAKSKHYEKQRWAYEYKRNRHHIIAKHKSRKTK